MSKPIIGWESETPIPAHHTFNHFLRAADGELWMDQLNLTKLIVQKGYANLGRTLTSPTEIVYLPMIRKKVRDLQDAFARAIETLGYPGKFHYVYASKANAAEEVVRTILGTGANYEFSSWMDIEIARQMCREGHLTGNQFILCNGFKPAGSRYSAELIKFQQDHGRVIPIIDSPDELAPLIEAGIPMEVGLRLKCYGDQHNAEEMDALNIRFGMEVEVIHQMAERIAAAPHLSLVMVHAMVGGQLTEMDEFLARLATPMQVYADLARKYPSLRYFNYGGGLPVGLTLDFAFDYEVFAGRLLGAFQQVCAAAQVPPPDVLGEMGRYTVAEHGAHIFRIKAVKNNRSTYPWYIIDGSIMSSFPDVWALAEHFIVLPLNHLDKPFQQVQLGGITCDSDDVYPPKKSHSPLYLPVETEDLYIAFFGVGAYQEMLGGVGGSKHCVIPEADEVVVDLDPRGEPVFEVLPGQGSAQVLKNLGYKIAG